jgi:2'-5' RNA ligase
MRKRLFIGIAIPDALRAKIHSLSERLKAEAPNLKASWVPPQNYHLTLQFLGSTELEAEVASALSTLKLSQFPLALGGLGAFPRQSKARVIWLGAGLRGHAGGEPLARVAAEVARLLLPLGFETEEGQEFSGHLTLARVKIPTDVSPILKPEAAVAFEPFLVKEILVFESKTTPTGSIYSELHRISLA